MTEFKRRCLNVLDSIYGFVGQKTWTSKLDLNAPIQLVHDTSREAELAGIGLHHGWAIHASQVTHAAANTQLTTIDIYGTLAAHGDFGDVTSEGEMDAWVYDIGVSLSASQLTSIMVGMAYGDIAPGGGTTNYFPLWYATEDTIYMCNYAGSAGVLVATQANGQINALPFNTLPRYIPHAEHRITVRTVSAAALVVELRLLLWVGRRGTTPPMMR